MKLDLFDSYNIRVRLSSSIIIFAPLVLTVFLCFDELFSFISSSVLVAILLAFTNCLPIFQRYICQKRVAFKNYAVEFLLPHDNTLNPVTKKRYYNILVKTNVAFAAFQSPNDSEGFRQCCESAVRYLREKTRNSPLVIEENINYGFYKTLPLPSTASPSRMSTATPRHSGQSWTGCSITSPWSMHRWC